MNHKIVVLDRDGVINQDSPGYIKSPEEWIPLPGSLDAIALLTQAEWTVVVASNQSGIGRGLFSMEGLNEMHRKMHKLVNQVGGKIHAVFFCPHTPDDHCVCRKPEPGMLIDISERFGSPLQQMIMIGDSLHDIEAIQAVGGEAILVRSGNGSKTLLEKKVPSSAQIFDNLLKAAQYLTTPHHHKRKG